MKVLVVGDTHANTAWAQYMVSLAKSLNCDALLQLGDFGIWPGPSGDKYLRKLNRSLNEAELPLYFVDGNHEDFPKLNKLRNGQQSIAPLVIPGARLEEQPMINHIPRGHVWEWEDKKFMGVGGAVSIDREWRIPGQSWWPEETINPAQEEYALAQAAKYAPIDVLLTHDAATTVPWEKGYKNDPDSVWHRQRVSDIAKIARPRLWLHGHMHRYMDYKFGYGDDESRVVGLDRDGNRDSWAVLQLPSMTLTPAAEYRLEEIVY